LQAVKKPHRVHPYTTSDYLRSGITRWVPGWQERHWHTREGKPVSHRDCWEALLQAAAEYQVQYHLVEDALLPEPMEQTRFLARQAAQAGAGASPGVLV
jgi:ribonuclease HI